MSILDDWFGLENDTQTSRTTVPQYITDAHRGAIERAQQLGQIGFMPYIGPEVAAPTPGMNAAYANADSLASAFGMQGGLSGGLPEPNSDAFGMPAYSSYPLLEQAMEQLRQRRPGQAEAYDAMFVDPYPQQAAPAPSGPPSASPGAFAPNPNVSGIQNLGTYLSQRDGISLPDAVARIRSDPGLRTQLQAELGYTGGQHKGGVGTGRMAPEAAAFFGSGGGVDPRSGMASFDAGFGSDASFDTIGGFGSVGSFGYSEAPSFGYDATRGLSRGLAGGLFGGLPGAIGGLASGATVNGQAVGPLGLARGVFDALSADTPTFGGFNGIGFGGYSVAGDPGGGFGDAGGFGFDGTGGFDGQAGGIGPGTGGLY